MEGVLVVDAVCDTAGVAVAVGDGEDDGVLLAVDNTRVASNPCPSLP